MKSLNTFIFVIFVTILVFAPVMAQEYTSDEAMVEVEISGPTDKAEFETFIDGVMAGHMEAYDFPGAIISVVKDGEIFFSKGYGYKDIASGAKNDPAKTMYRPGSVSKLFTWTAVMQQVEEGKLDLDADINTYLKTFQIENTFDKPVTLRSALTHTPGFEDGAVGYLFGNSPEYIIGLKEALAKYPLARVRPIDEFASYSNYATALAGLAVANVSGMDFNTYIDEKILKPLGMAHSTFREPLPANIADYMATGYLHEGGVFKAYGFEYVTNFGPAGAMSASADDMARFMIAHLQNGRYGNVRILKEETAKEMHSLLFAHDPRINGFAHGFYQDKINDKTFIGHGGDTIYFHSMLRILKEENFGVYISYNAPEGAIARSKLLQAIMDRYYPSAIEARPIPVPVGFKERAQKYLGNFRNNRHNYSSSEKMFTGIGSMAIGLTEEGYLAIGESKFVEIDKNLFQQVDGKNIVAFRENKAGEITHYFSNGSPMSANYRIGDFEVLDNQLMILGFGFLFFLTAVTGAIRKRRDGDEDAKAMRKYAAIVGAAYLAFLIFFGGIASSLEINSLIFEIPPSIGMSLNLVYLLLIATLVLVWKGIAFWKDGVGTRWERVHYSSVTVFSIIFLMVMNYYNILGNHF